VVFVILSDAIAARGQLSPPPSLSCPSTVKVTETASPVDGWKSISPPKEHDFERVSIYNVDKEGREYDLAPDEQARTAGNAAVITTPPWPYIKEAPPALTRCTFTFALDKNGNFIGKSDLVCR